jgi:ABC-type phosphate transport system substrate-binding protein
MRILLILLLCCTLPVLADPTIIGHPGLSPLDPATLQRIYTGKVVELNGARVTPVNLPPGNALRTRFLRNYLEQDEDKYTGYWTVRRYVGKGSPPRELGNPEEVTNFIAKTAGAIGYVDETELTPEVKVLLQKSP